VGVGTKTAPLHQIYTPRVFYGNLLLVFFFTFEISPLLEYGDVDFPQYDPYINPIVIFLYRCRDDDIALWLSQPIVFVPTRGHLFARRSPPLFTVGKTTLFFFCFLPIR